MTNDRLAEIKARRANVPAGPFDIDPDTDYEEYYAQFRRIEHGERDEHGHRDSIALAWDDEGAEFIANAPADIDWLVGEVERLRTERS
jgi:hypothetical protein